MNTIVVWVLVLTFRSNSYGIISPVVIDNIASVQNCNALAASMAQWNQANEVKCIAVRKVKL